MMFYLKNIVNIIIDPNQKHDQNHTKQYILSFALHFNPEMGSLANNKCDCQYGEVHH